MKITITSKKYDKKTGVHVTRERGFAVAEFGKCLRHVLLGEENDYAGAVADAARTLRTPKGKVRKAVGEYILDLIDDMEVGAKCEAPGDITIGDEEAGHDIEQ